MQELFSSIFSSSGSDISVANFIFCILSSLGIGLLYMLSVMVKSNTSKSYRVSLLLLPVAVAVIIMMVNGSIGVGIAIAGAFSLVKFRSAQGNAKDICILFVAMGSGLIVGVGYLMLALIYALITCAVILAINIGIDKFDFVDKKRVLKIIVPEDVDYQKEFKDMLSKYTKNHKLTHIKTADFGSVFKLTYDITLKNADTEQAIINSLRVKNGNLEVMIMKENSEADF